MFASLGRQSSKRVRELLPLYGVAILILSVAAVRTALAAPHSECSVSDPIEPGYRACPDLKIIKAGAKRLDDGSVTVRAEIRNEGDAAAGPSQLQIGVSGGRGRIRSGANAWQTVPVNGINAKDATVVEANIRVPPESRGITLTADPQERVPEEEESNNTYTLAAPVAKLADLVFTSVEARAAEARPNGAIVQATVMNRGESKSPEAGLTVKVGNVAAEGNVAPLNPGESQTIPVEIDLPRDLPADKRIASLYVDRDNRIRESDERNNTGRVELPLPPPPARPDLTITEARANGAIVQATVMNRGKSKTPEAGLTVKVGNVTAEGNVPPLNSGESQTISVEIDLPRDLLADSRVASIYVDPDNRIRESNERNNTSLVVLPPRILRRPTRADLAITDRGARLISDADVVIVEATITNVGHIDTPSTRLAVETPTEGRTAEVPPLKPGESKTVSVQMGVPHHVADYSRTASLYVDPDNTILEANENNNRREVVLPAPPGDNRAIRWWLVVVPILVAAMALGTRRLVRWLRPSIESRLVDDGFQHRHVWISEPAAPTFEISLIPHADPGHQEIREVRIVKKERPQWTART